jgi:DNA repair ATPase RecN
MPICKVCGGYYIREPCPICAEEHVPETMSPSVGISPDSLRQEVSIEGSIKGSITATEDQIKQVQEDIKAEKDKWMSQITAQRDKVADLEARMVDLDQKEKKISTEVQGLKEKRSTFQASLSTMQETTSKLEESIVRLTKEKKESESTLQNLKVELQSLS